jgi:hypothetical protein
LMGVPFRGSHSRIVPGRQWGPLLHPPHDVHEVIDGAWQLEQAIAASEAILSLGLFQEHVEQRGTGGHDRGKGWMDGRARKQLWWDRRA